MKPVGVSDAAELLRGAAALCVCALLFTALLWSGVAAAIGIQARYDVILLPLCLGAAFFGLARLPRALLLPGLTLPGVVFCGAVLSGVWGAAVSDLSLQVGLFQQSDSFTKLDGALRLLYGGELSESVSRRPLAPAIAAAVLAACQGSIRGLLATTVFLAAVALALPVREVIRTHGWKTGYLMSLGLLLFYRRFIGTCLSEHVGLALGCLAFALLWRSARHARLVPALAGIFVLTLALNARAGAFFVLPALALWTGWVRRGAARFSVVACVAGCIAAGSGFALNSFVLHAAGTPGAAMGNFSYTLYGLVHGGDWTKVLQDHPEVRSLPEIERNRAIYDLALRRISDRPLSLASGTGRAYRSFFLSSSGPFSFLLFALQRSDLQRPAPERTSENLRRRIAADPWKYLHIAATFGWFLGLSALAIAGVVALTLDRGPEAWLALCAGAGILASVPFAPPWDADLMRAYAATMPFMLLFPAMAAPARLARPGRALSSKASTPSPPAGDTGLLVLAFLVVPLVCLAPLMLRQRPSPAPPAAGARADGALWTLRLLPGSQVRLEGGKGFTPWSDSIDPSVARRNTGILARTHPDRASELDAVLSSGGILAMGYDRRARALRHLLLDDSQPGLLGTGWTDLRAEPIAGGEDALWWRVGPAAEVVPGSAP